MISSLQMQAHAWQLLSLGLLSLALLVAVVSDARTRRVPNTLVLTVLLLGVALHTLGPQPWRDNEGLFSLNPGAVGFFSSLLGASVAFLIFLPLYVMRALGAGDVKLLSGVGAFAGATAFLNIALWVLVAGGVFAVVRMAIAGQLSQLLTSTVSVMTGQFKPAKTLWRMPYAVAIAAGVAAHAAWVFSGRTPILNF